MDARQDSAPKGSNASLWIGTIVAMLLGAGVVVGFVWLVVRAVGGDGEGAASSRASASALVADVPPPDAARTRDPRPALPPNATTAPKPSPIRGRTFDADEADAEIAVAASKASRCKGPPSGKGSARVVFGPGGNVVAVFLTAPFATSFVAPCIEVAFRSARVPPFDGDAQRVKTGGEENGVVIASFSIR